MPKKPWIILLISGIYCISPLLIVTQAAMMVQLPVFGTLHIWSKLSLFDFFVLSLYIVAAVSVWSLKKPGWYIFMIVSAILIFSNIYAALLRPSYQLLSILIYDSVLTFAAILFFKKSIITPYFTPRLRWWENLSRYSTQVHLFVDDDTPESHSFIRDISQTGCYITREKELCIDQEYEGELYVFGNSITLKARVVRIATFQGITGYGLMFFHQDRKNEKKLQKMIAALEKLFHENSHTHTHEDHIPRATRITLDERVWICINGEKTKVEILDFSESGCSIKTKEGLNTKDNLGICWKLREKIIEVPCRIVWEQEKSSVFLYGVCFGKTEKRTEKALKKLVLAFKKYGAKKRKLTPLPKEVIAAAADLTPYRYVKKIKRFLHLPI